MNEAAEAIWSSETHEYLNTWADWTRGHQAVRGTRNVLADMIKRASDGIYIPATDTAYDFTFDVEVTDKAVARLRMEGLHRLKSIIMGWYLGRQSYFALSRSFRTSEDVIKMQHWAAVSAVGRFRFEVERELNKKRHSVKFGCV